jgi:hypothetical protein
VNRAIEEMICSQFSAETWLSISHLAGVDRAHFLSMDQYPDEVTYRLVGAASQVLHLDADHILEGFGRFWTKYTAQEGYGDLLHMAGDSFLECLKNLDNLHTRVGMSYPHLRPPSFYCSDQTDTSIRLHYLSERSGLAPMVVGLLYGLAEVFQTKIQVELAESRAAGHSHDVFLITF